MGKIPEEFDGPNGWGAIASREGVSAASVAINEYLESNDLSTYWKNVFRFRLAQIEAIQGMETAPISFLETLNGNPEWDAYVLATVYFLSGNLEGIDSCLKDLSSLGLVYRNSTVQKVKKLRWLVSQGVDEYRVFINPLRLVPRIR